MPREQYFTKSGFTDGLIKNRAPGDGKFYNLSYFKGGKNDLGVPYHEDDVKPDSHYRHKAIANLRWINKYVSQGIVIDAGAGPGHMSYWAEALKYPYEIISCDLSEELLNSKYNLNPKRSIVSQIYDLPIANNSTNAVMFADVLEHVYPEEAEKAIQEANRILINQGYVFIRIPNREACNWNKYHLKDKSHVWLPSPKEMRQLLIRNGFHEVKMQTREFPIITHLARKYTSGEIDLRLPSFVPGSSMMISAKK